MNALIMRFASRIPPSGRGSPLAEHTVPAPSMPAIRDHVTGLGCRFRMLIAALKVLSAIPAGRLSARTAAICRRDNSNRDVGAEAPPAKPEIGEPVINDTQERLSASPSAPPTNHPPAEHPIETIVDASETTGGRQAKKKRLPQVRYADETLALLVTLLNSAPFGFALIDRSYRYICVNDVMAEMHGVLAANHVGCAVAEIVPRLWPELAPIYRSIIETGRSGVPHLEVHTGDKPGAERIILANHYPVRIENEIIGIGIVLIDITEQRRLEERLHRAQRMEAIGNLTGGMAHDFNNLLGVIIGNLDLIGEQLDDNPELADLLGDASDAAWRGADLTQRLLSFARRQPLQPALVDVNDLVSATMRMLGRVLGEDIEISLDLGQDIRCVMADPAQLEASLTNLVTNARDAMPQGGKLIIATSNCRLDADYAATHDDVVEGDYVKIEVSDTGVGMPSDVASRIFEPFFTTKEDGKGTGLGLAMVFGFLKQSGGHICVYSEPGVGTTFRLYLPRVTAAASEAVPPTATVAPGGGETVLVVEDNPSVRRVVVRQLRDLGYRVRQSGSAPAALDVLRSEPIDLLFTDIVMPGDLDGIELAHQALEQWPALKIVLTSGFPQARNDKIPTDLPLLAKPYRKGELAAVLRAAFDR